jgi:hypothetical protein
MRIALTIIVLLMAFLPVGVMADGPDVLKQGEVLRGTFVQERVLQGFDAPLRSAGDFTLAPGQGLIWRATQPFVVTTLMTDKGLAQDSGGTTTLNLAASRVPIMADLYAMLSGAMAGDWTSLEQRFAIERSEVDGKWQLRLRPKAATSSGDMPIKEIRLSGGAFVDTVEIEKTSGDLDRLTFSQQQRAAGPLTPAETALLETVGRQ